MQCIVFFLPGIADELGGWGTHGYFPKHRHGIGPETRTSSKFGTQNPPSLQREQRFVQDNKAHVCFSSLHVPIKASNEHAFFSDSGDQIVAIICANFDEVESHAFMAAHSTIISVPGLVHCTAQLSEAHNDL